MNTPTLQYENVKKLTHQRNNTRTWKNEHTNATMREHDKINTPTQQYKNATKLTHQRYNARTR